MAITDIVRNIDYRKVRTSSGTTYAQELVNDANLLARCIQSRIHQETMQDVITTADLADVITKDNHIEVTLKIQSSIRPSIFYKWNKTNANVFWLLNDGYVVKKPVWFRRIRNFGYRVGADFVRKGIEDYKKSCKLGLEPKVIRPLFYYGQDVF